jgi:hypothetical protein
MRLEEKEIFRNMTAMLVLSKLIPNHDNHEDKEYLCRIAVNYADELLAHILEKLLKE